VVAACAYCKGFIGLRAPIEDPTITHGICDACLAEQLRELEHELGEGAAECPWTCEAVPDSLELVGPVG
jgi:hypothetical protein